MSQLTGSFGCSVALRFRNDLTTTVGSIVNWSADVNRAVQINSGTAGTANQVLILSAPGQYDLTTLTGAYMVQAGPGMVADITAYAPDKVFGVVLENLSTNANQTLTLSPGDTNPLNIGTVIVQPGGFTQMWFPTGMNVTASAKNIKVVNGAAGAVGRLTLIVHSETD